MLRVKTRVWTSKIHGLGLFADEFIPKGTVTWEYEPAYDISFSEHEIRKLPQIKQDFLYYYCYLDKKMDKLILCSDNQRYINHSTIDENILSTPKRDIAARDIQIGEELLCDYNKFDDTYFERIGIHESELKGHKI
jgi:uncharacterized protein